jgi:hypothetical protein
MKTIYILQLLRNENIFIKSFKVGWLGLESCFCLIKLISLWKVKLHSKMFLIMKKYLQDIIFDLSYLAGKACQGQTLCLFGVRSDEDNEVK